MEPTDIITKFVGKLVEASNVLPRIVGSTRPGAKTDLEVWRKGATRTLSLTVGELQESKLAALETPRAQKPAALAANRLGIVVSELSAKQKEELKVSGGLVVTEVKPEARAEVRRGDVLMALVHKGQHTELKSIEQLNKLLSGLDKNAVITLQVRRGDAMAFVTVNGLTDKG